MIRNRLRAMATVGESCFFHQGRSSSSTCAKSTAYLDFNDAVASLASAAKRSAHRYMVAPIGSNHGRPPALTGNGSAQWCRVLRIQARRLQEAPARL